MKRFIITILMVLLLMAGQVWDAGSWTWGTPQVYDGSWNPGIDLVIEHTNEYPFHIKGIDFWRSPMTQSFFEGKY